MRVEGENRENTPQQPVISQKPAAEVTVLPNAEPRQLQQTGFIDYSKLHDPTTRQPSTR